MKQKLKDYFQVVTEEELSKAILKNEHKHLSIEYRNTLYKMTDLLHTDFYEKSESGVEYSKESILKLMPFGAKNCKVSDFSYSIDEDSLNCEYLLNEDDVFMKCNTKWMFEKGKLRLRVFNSKGVE